MTKPERKKKACINKKCRHKGKLQDLKTQFCYDRKADDLKSSWCKTCRVAKSKKYSESTKLNPMNKVDMKEETSGDWLRGVKQNQKIKREILYGE